MGGKWVSKWDYWEVLRRLGAGGDSCFGAWLSPSTQRPAWALQALDLGLGELWVGVTRS